DRETLLAAAALALEQVECEEPVSPVAYRPSPHRSSDPSPHSSESAHPHRRWLLRAHDDSLAATPFRRVVAVSHLILKSRVPESGMPASVRSADARVAC